MIKIDPLEIEKIKSAYFTGVSPLIISRLNLFEIAFKVIRGEENYSSIIANTPNIHWKTRTALLKCLIKSDIPFNSQNDYALLANANSIIPHFHANSENFLLLIKELKVKGNLHQLILSLPGELLELEQCYIPGWDTLENMQPLIERFFDYGAFCSKEKDRVLTYNAYDLSEALQVNVCPYCNRLYTSTVKKDSDDCIVRPSLDHFFSKSQHPFLALSFYNLIPSCSNCNSYLKGKLPFNLDTHLHPYLEGFEHDGYFDFWFRGLHKEKSHPGNFKVLLKSNPNSKKIKQLEGNPIDNSEGNIKVFRLREIYETHADFIGELYAKMDKTSPYYANSIFKFIGRLNSTKQEFYRFYFGNYINEKEFNKRPLAKLTKDIVAKYLPGLFE